MAIYWPIFSRYEGGDELVVHEGLIHPDEAVTREALQKCNNGDMKRMTGKSVTAWTEATEIAPAELRPWYPGCTDSFVRLSRD